MKPLTTKQWLCQNSACVYFDDPMHRLPVQTTLCPHCKGSCQISDVPASYQFFTEFDNWCPIDHFFYGAEVCEYQPRGSHFGNQAKSKRQRVVHLEGHASVSSPSGFSVSVIQGDGEEATSEEFPDYPSALRRMADIIETFEKEHLHET